tara:strand:- start:1260 stop:1463 length:204 start_codon:yes stop_codon:yes gene_type:complete
VSRNVPLPRPAVPLARRARCPLASTRWVPAARRVLAGARPSATGALDVVRGKLQNSGRFSACVLQHV